MKKKIIIVPSIILLAVCVVIPLIIHFHAPFVPSELSADGVLTYVIEAISAIATIALALVAVWQTRHANEISKSMLKIEEHRRIMEVRPFVMVTGWRGVFIDDKEKVLLHPDKMYIEVGDCRKDKLAGLELSIQNVTNGYLSLSFSEAKSEVDIWKPSYSSQPKMSVSILPGEVGTITFVAVPEFFKSQESKTIHFEFILENRFSNRYKEEFDVILVSFTDDCVHKDGEYYCYLNVQNFSIARFETKKEKMELVPEQL